MDNFEELSLEQLEAVDGGTFKSFMYNAYKTAVSYPTAAIGGYKLANQFYGDKVTWHDRFRAMGDVQHMLAASDSLPAWARFGR